ncbi:ABC transporter permease [Clostridium sp. FP2]|uniref:ABC transporter permease n=1 Tax=Clostridium TaxID=1485 RepID=UPI0013E940B0|nr:MULTISPECIES: ABC transporter permease [Clostridium]MBW9157604.1 ABC transporter permease [Clostridium tagluense]MBZ9622685.1 ABC transporter permease [Clostridium sp. FP2]WLC66968.1 ABC transporter permease [Clostridium tagluense]
MDGLIINILEQGFIFAIMAIGVYITYRILDFPDLSVDGTFALGAAVTAAALIKGVNPYISLLLAFVSGMMAGGVTGILHVKLKITNLLSGILVMIGLYSINLRIMGKANIPLFSQNTIFSNDISPVIIIALFAILAKIALDLFLKTKLGFILRATGDNPQMVTSLGVDIGTIKILGLMISNGLVAVSGSMMAQYQRFSDVGMGTGIIVMGLASVILGEAIFKKASWWVPTTTAILGSILYKGSISFALKLGLPPTDLKLVTCIIVIFALALNGRKFNFNFKRLKRVNLGGVPIAPNK